MPTPTGTPIIDADDEDEPVSVEEQEALKVVIQSYFDMRYQALSVSQPYGFQSEGFDDLVSGEPDAQAFLDAELSHLALQIKYAELNWSRYVDYKFFLDFSSFTVDPTNQLVTVSVLESNEIVYEISARSKSANPHVAKMSGLKHTIVLHKEQTQWKIVSDSYNDVLWRTMRTEGKSAKEMLNTLNTMKAQSMPAVRSEGAQIAELPNLNPDPSSHDYNRQGAAYYAITHAEAQSYNPNYPSYDDKIHGDCTNFVSQALYEGGNISMDIPTSPIPGEETSGWYLLNDWERATDWNDVNGFYEFAATPDDREWAKEGPEGYLLDLDGVPVGGWPAGLEIGDVIQYNSGYDDIWEHSAIVVEFDSETGDPLVASHSPNIPVINFNAVVPHVKTRFIHIERSDGYPPVKAEITSAIDDAGGYTATYGACIATNPDPLRNYLGSCFNGKGDITSGFQFRNIKIPTAAQIKYAFVTFTIDGLYTSDPKDTPAYFYYPIRLEIRGEDTAVPSDFSNTNPPANRDNLTWDMVPWNITQATPYNRWKDGEKRTTPDLKEIIHPIVMLEDWRSGNKISLIFKNGIGSAYPRRTIAFEDLQESELIPARLIVAYDIVPRVSSIVVANTSSDNINFRVTFSEAVTGVDTGDFRLTTNAPGATISDVSGSGAIYTVTVWWIRLFRVEKGSV